jgi:hypothetical protein
MDNTMIDTKDVIISLKQVKEEKGLSLDKILVLMNENDPTTAVSKTTLSRVFAKDSENQLFRYETTLRPIANVLLDVENYEDTDSIDEKAMKALLKYKIKRIEELEQRVSELEHALNSEKVNHHEKMDAARAQWQKSVDFLKEQISLKDKRMDMLLEAIFNKDSQHNELMEAVMSCPLRKKN